MKNTSKSYFFALLLVFFCTSIDKASAQETQLSDSTIDFGEVFVGDSLIKVITLYNIGTDTLTLDSIIIIDSSFNAFFEKDSLINESKLASGDSVNIFVNFTPTMVGEFSDTVSIESQNGNIKFLVFGSGLKKLPPEIVVAPLNYDISLVSGDSIDMTMSITNAGESDLSYSVKSPKDIGVLFSAEKAFDEDILQDFLQIVKYSVEDLIPIDTIYTSVFDELRAVSLSYYLGKVYFQNFWERKNIYVVDVASKEIDRVINLQTEEEFVISSLSHSGEYLYAAVGDKIISINEYTGEIADTLQDVSVSGLAFHSINKVDKELYKNVTSETINVYDLYTGDFKSTLIDDPNYSFTDFSYSHAKKAVIALGRNLSTNDLNLYTISTIDGEITDSTLVSDATIYALASDEVPLSNFLSIESERVDTISGGQTNQINFKINAVDVDMGNYSSEILITSNDPVNPLIEIPIAVEVIGGPEISVSPEQFNFSMVKGDSLNSKIEISNTGFSELNYSISTLKKSKTGAISFFTGEVDDNTNVIQYSINEGIINTVDTLYSRPFGAFGIRGMSLYKDELFFIDDKDDFEIISMNVKTREISGRYSFEGFPEIYATAQYKDKLIAKKFDFEANLDHIVTVDFQSGTFPDTLASTNDFGESIQTITVNSQTNELLAIVNSGIKILNLDTKEVSEFVSEGESLRFQHFSYSPFEDRLYVSGYDLTKPEGQNLGVFIYDYETRELIEFKEFHTEFSAFSFDETGAPAFIDILSGISDTLQANEKSTVEFKIDSKNLNAGTYEAEFLISSNDREAKLLRLPFQLNVKGNSVLSINQDTLKLELTQGESLSGRVEVFNSGESFLDYSFTTQVHFPNNMIPERDNLFIISGGREEISGQEFSIFMTYSKNLELIQDTLFKLPQEIDLVYSLAYHDRRLFYYDPNTLNPIQVFDLDIGKVIDEIELPFEFGYVYSMSHSGSSIYATIQEDGINAVHLVEINAFEKTVTDTLLSYNNLAETPVLGVTYNPIKDVLYLCSNTNEIQIYDLKERVLLNDVFTIQGYLINSLSFEISSNTIFAFGLNPESQQDYKIFEIDPENDSILEEINTNGIFFSSIATNESGFVDFIEFESGNRDTIDVASSKEIRFSLASEVLLPGKYGFDVVISSNDPENPVVRKPVVITIKKLVGNESEYAFPTQLELSQNYPNPFNPSTNIEYGLPEAGDVQIRVFNILGQQVMTLVDEFKSAGRYTAVFDARQLSSGVYFYKLSLNGAELQAKKMLLLK